MWIWPKVIILEGCIIASCDEWLRCHHTIHNGFVLTLRWAKWNEFSICLFLTAVAQLSCNQEKIILWDESYCKYFNFFVIYTVAVTFIQFTTPKLPHVTTSPSLCFIISISTIQIWIYNLSSYSADGHDELSWGSLAWLGFYVRSSTGAVRIVNQASVLRLKILYPHVLIITSHKWPGLDCGYIMQLYIYLFVCVACHKPV